MVFWIVVAAVVVALLLVAWRVDRKRRVSVERRNPSAEQAYASGIAQADRHRLGGDTNLGSF